MGLIDSVFTPTPHTKTREDAKPRPQNTCPHWHKLAEPLPQAMSDRPTDLPLEAENPLNSQGNRPLLLLTHIAAMIPNPMAEELCGGYRCSWLVASSVR